MPSTFHTCPNCSAPLAAEARFCQSCGQAISQTAPAAAGKSRRTIWLLAAAGAAVLACFGCLFLAGAGVLVWKFMPVQPVLSPTPVIVVETSLPPAETPVPVLPAPTASPPPVTPTVPAVTPLVETPAAAQPDGQPPEGSLAFSGGGARFFYDPSLAAAVNVEEVAANPPAEDLSMPPWSVFPAHVQIFFQDYPARGSMHTAQIIIYPVEEYQAMLPDVGDKIRDLRQMLQFRPELVSDDQALPFLPYWNAGQMIHAGGRYIDNETVSGMRYLTQYGQDIGPVSSDRLFYTFQGLTHDGKYYIAAVMPIGHLMLPDSSQYSTEEYQALADNYAAYQAETREMLEALPGSSFKPGLDLLDALFESFEVGENQ